MREEVLRSVVISKHTHQSVFDTHGKFFAALSQTDALKQTNDVLSPTKVIEQVKIIERMSGESVCNKKLLEIGSGFGIFVTVTNKVYQVDAYGVEPSGEGFAGSFELSQLIAEDSDVDVSRIKEGVGETLPYPENTFDVVYSTNVLEHVQDPEKVFQEAVRVCKPGGFIQVVIPNYGSFFDGHYACLYIPYQPKWLWKFYIKYVLKRDPAFVDTLRTELNQFSVSRMLRKLEDAGVVDVLDYGRQIFKERMLTQDWDAYAGLYKLKPMLMFLRRIGFAKIVTYVLLLMQAHTPIIISLRKK